MKHVLSGIAPGRIFMLFLSESLLVAGSYVWAAYMDPDLTDAGLFLLYESGILRVAIVVCVILAGFYITDLYTQIRIRSRVLLFQQLSMVFGVAFISQGLISYLHRDWTIPRKMMITGSLAALASVCCWRLLFDIATRGSIEARRVLFLGISPTVVQLAGYFKTHPEFGLAPVGYLSGGHDADARAGAGTLPLLGSISDLNNLLDNIQPNSIVIGRREDIKPWWANDFLELRFGGIQSEQAATLYEKTFSRICAAEIWPSKLVFGNTWKTQPITVSLQSIYSIVIGFLALVALFPFMAVIGVLIRTTSRSAALIRETRIGLQGVPFTMYRFRCARESAFGQFLRRSGLDALPQLLNVVAGHMALVGPRPDRPEFARRLAEEIPFYPQRYQVKPGMTGWADIHWDPDSNQRDTVRRLEYDLYYVKKLSPLLDSLVLLLSLKNFLVRG